jgi:hypothetical protein
MPCRDDYPDEVSVEKDRTISALETEIKTLRARLDERTSQLCEAMRIMPDGRIGHCSMALQSWWRHHQEFDRKEGR